MAEPRLEVSKKRAPVAVMDGNAASTQRARAQYVTPSSGAPPLPPLATQEPSARHAVMDQARVLYDARAH
eukprot:COSAG01_NODE_51244_length_356_cov_0.996109_1_plen_69_part_01